MAKPCGVAAGCHTYMSFDEGGRSVWVLHHDHIECDRRFVPGAIDRLGEVREWQAVQRARNEIHISLELMPKTHPNQAQLQQRLFSELRELGLRDTSCLTMTLVGKLSPDASTGKFRRLISHVGPPNDLKQSLADINAPMLF